MALTVGTRLGPYEVTSALGRGGMGEVFRARDTRLNREVALKALPDLFASDPERLARFEREAQVLAALNHPNIAHIHGLEESGFVRALVMELVPRWSGDGRRLFFARDGEVLEVDVQTGAQLQSGCAPPPIHPAPDRLEHHVSGFRRLR